MSNLDDGHHAGEKKPIHAAVGAWPRSLPTWAGTVFLVCLSVSGVLALSYFANHVSAVHDPSLATDDAPGSGTITESVIRDVWVFPSLVELAKCRTHPEQVDSFEGLKRFLEVRGQERLWYAVTFRANQVNGREIDLTFVRQPYRDPAHFLEFRTILSLAAGAGPHEAVDASLAATLHLLPENLSGREPLEVMGELLGNP
jgi:hypothetical protein